MRIQLGPNAVGWYLDEIQGWIESRIRAGGRAPKRGEPVDAAPDPEREPRPVAKTFARTQEPEPQPEARVRLRRRA